MADLSGQKFDNYHLIRLLGSGAFGSVYLGEHIDDQKMVAIKALQIDLNQDTLKSFLNEARAIFRLKHPHIIPLEDFGVHGDTPFLVTMYASNGTLRRKYPQGTQLAPETILPYVKQIADALQYVHSKRLIHRDIKPQNLLLDANNQILLSDFGLAMLAHRENSLSTLASLAGTLPYMAPEQLQRKPRPASDQYSLGIVVYEWLCGCRPFQGSEIELLHQHLFDSPPPLRGRVPALSAELERVVLKALAKDPDERFGSVQEFASALEQAIENSRPLSISPLDDPHERVLIPELPITDKFPIVSHQVSLKSSAAIDYADLSESDNIDRVLAQSDVAHVQSRAVLSSDTVSFGPIGDILTKRLPDRRDPVPIWRRPQPRRRWPRIVGLISLFLLISLLVWLGTAMAQPNQILSFYGGGFGTSSIAKVTITPDSQIVENNYVITGVTSAANAQQRQIGVRTISGKATMQPKTVNTTGVAKTEAAMAKGNITFFNISPSPVAIASGTVFDLGGGLRIVTDQTAVIPAAQLPTAGFVSVPAHAEPSGTSGNIRALAIDQGCCTGGVSARNTEAFTGGQDGKDYKFVLQADIDGVINASNNQFVQQATAELNKQLKAGEKIAGSVQCEQQAGANQKVGDQGANVPNVTVTLEVTCAGLAYNQQEVDTLASQLLQQQVSNDTKLTPGYTLNGKVITQTTVQGVQPNKVNLLVNTKGLWVFQVDDATKQDWAQQLAGKELEQARTLLGDMRGVKEATIDFGGTTLPTDLTLFTFTINPVNPLPESSGTSPAGTPTVTGGSSAG